MYGVYSRVYGRVQQCTRRAEQVVGTGSAHHRRLLWRRGLCTACSTVMRLRELYCAVQSQPETSRWVN